ncbi:SWI/SNF complex subunit SWI3A-like isoform X2 [Iris pallida]|uniref:SWI/SNF complex subunit SWI3A-like isoform X2 n=1 Tax=Iris pallida TaxID=29817 RepID=A0AAX6I9X2_IRIPA|nr:SWI/SNF complex subunit SWI3A-like isoform X2 [Iris pallida]
MGRDPRRGAAISPGVLLRERLLQEPQGLPGVPRLHHQPLPRGPLPPPYLHRGQEVAVGDVGLLRKVFQFLDRWGLINFGVPGGESEEVGAGASAAVVVEDGAPAGVKVVPAASAAASERGTVGGGGGENGFRLPPLTSYRDVFIDEMPGKGPLCGNCGGDCDSGESKSSKGGYSMCTKCSEKKNTEEKTTDDLKVNNHGDGNEDQVSNTWTDAESLLLLEAVLKHGDDWDLIAQHVRSKTKLECIAHLIHLPFGEHMLGLTSSKLDNRQPSSEVTQVKAAKSPVTELSEESIKAVGEQHIDTDEQEKAVDVSSPAHALKRRRFTSFSDATDSLMKQVALLSTVAGPQVAAAAAESAVAALCHENPCALKAFEIDQDEVAKFGSHIMKDELESELKVEGQDLKEHRKRVGMKELYPEKNFGAATFRIRASVATSIGAAAARAKLLADQEEREMELLMASIIEMQLKKIRSKMKHFQELELIMEKEYAQIQHLKESILEEWVRILQQAFHSGIPRWRDSGLPKFLPNANM